MSSAGARSERIDSDFYPTPAWCTRRLLETRALPSFVGSGFDGVRPALWADPCAGDGAILRVVRESFADLDGDFAALRPLLFGFELREACRAPLQEVADATAICDYLACPIAAPARLDVIITNPPFSIAEQVIRKALREASWCAFLTRQGFLASEERSDWLRNDMPDSYDLPNRPSFAASLKCLGRKFKSPLGPTEDSPCGWQVLQPLAAPRAAECPECGGRVRVTTSDSADYCWLVWTPERGRREGRRVILPSTTLAERKAA